VNGWGLTYDFRQSTASPSMLNEVVMGHRAVAGTKSENVIESDYVPDLGCHV